MRGRATFWRGTRHQRFHRTNSGSGLLRGLAVAIFILPFARAPAATLVVPSDQYTYLGEAMDAAAPGDTVSLLPGAHSAGNVVLKNNVSVVGSGASATYVSGFYDFVSVFKAEGVNGVVLEGLTIFGSRGDRPSPTGTPKGGALSCIASEVVIRDSVIARCDLRSTYTTGYGGAIHVSDGSSLTLVDSVLRDNYADSGGAIYLTGSSLTMTGCAMESNYASGPGGAVRIVGPGDILISECRILRNSGVGALSCSNARILMRNCVVSNNFGGAGGAGAWLYDCDLSATNCVIGNNILMDGTDGVMGGAGVKMGKGSLTLTNCTIAGNKVQEYRDEDTYRRGGGIFVDEVTANITNCIFWDNTEDISYTTKAELNVSFCDIEDMFPGKGILHVPPRFLDPENGDFRLLGDSPCIDLGKDDAAVLPETDIEGNPRVIFGRRFDRPDLGAYEYDPSLPLEICTQSLGSSIADHEYRQELKATGAFAPYSWFLLSGNLPPGLGLSREGILSGIPSRPGSYEFTLLTATLEAQAEQRSYQLDVSGYEHWYVDANVASPGDGKSPGTALVSIQDAVYSAGEGDIVHVAPGLYPGPIEVDVPIDLLGPGPDQATIDGQQGGSAISFWLLPFGKLSGFRIANGLADKGGGLFLYESGIAIENCVVESNSANYLGGGIYANLSPAKITDCIVRNNVTGLGTYYAVQSGGGIYSYFSPLEIDRCIVENNGVTQAGYPYWGGGLTLHGSHPTLTNCLIAKNYLDSPSAYKLGAGIFALFGSPVIINCTVADNYIEDTGFVYRVGGIGASCCWPTVRNSIVWGNGIDLVDAPAEFSLVGTPPKWVEGRGNISLDPEFVDPASGDYHPKDTSPCIDSALNLYVEDYETDLDGNTRILNGLVDMGTYENPRHGFGRLVIGKGDDAVKLTWNSLPGETYAIESTVDFLHWELVRDQPSQGVYTSWRDGDSLFCTKFYRVRRDQP